DYLNRQEQADLVIKTPSIPPKFMTAKYTTATNIFFANTKAITIGITGTKGKSTTASLTYHVLQKSGKKAYLAGNIGKPMLSLVDKVGRGDIVVLELSSYQLADVVYSPHIAVILNIYQELHNHKSLHEYKQAKFNIIKFAKSDDYYVYNPAFGELKRVSTHAQKIPVKLYGEDENTDAARTICSILGISYKDFDMGSKTYKSLPHRLQTIGQYREITFINDSAATHPVSTIRALKHANRVKTLICGGLDRGYDMSHLSKSIRESGVETLILFPDTGDALEELLLSDKVRILKTDDMDLAVRFAYKHTPKNSICLLSPGAPSYLTFKNFVDRGEQFVHYVRKYA
ncbi:MAG: Mur ligase family protein, partial [Candidatus Paceibacterota bacterium]